MPESRHDHALHTNEEVSNFATVGDARGAAWLKTHADDLAKARERMAAWTAKNAQTAPPGTAAGQTAPPVAEPEAS